LKFLNRKTTGKDRLPRRHDAIIVLGAEIYADGRPSVALRRRVVHGVELLKSGAADRIVFSGGPKKGLPTEARVMRQLAVVQGVYDDQIILKEASQSTLGNALACSLICKNNEWLNVFLVSSQ
jgi:vancomycin permeability regulator SanA